MYNYQFIDAGISVYGKPIIACGFKEDIASYLGHVYVKKQNNNNDFNEDEVLIENQPTLKNPTMKTISTLLYSYFVMRGITDKQGTISNVRFICPSNKLKVNKVETDATLNKKGKNEYFAIFNR